MKSFAYVSKSEVEAMRNVREWEVGGSSISNIFGEETCRSSYAGIWRHEPGTKEPVNGWKWHDDEQIEYIVSGHIRVEIGDADGNVVEDTVIGPGAIFFIGKEIRHRAEIVGEEPCIGVTFSPKTYPLSEGQPQIYDHDKPHG